MLVEIFSPAFKENGNVRPPIKFSKGLNVIQGTQKASNSIGKSSALLAIDFVFGGDTYLDSDGVRNLGDHTIYSCFELDKKYYFGRSTENPATIIICNNDYSETNESISKKDFLNFLMEKYDANKTDLTFRQLISTYLEFMERIIEMKSTPCKVIEIKVLKNLLKYC